MQLKKKMYFLANTEHTRKSRGLLGIQQCVGEASPRYHKPACANSLLSSEQESWLWPCLTGACGKKCRVAAGMVADTLESHILSPCTVKRAKPFNLFPDDSFVLLSPWRRAAQPRSLCPALSRLGACWRWSARPYSTATSSADSTSWGTDPSLVQHTHGLLPTNALACSCLNHLSWKENVSE